MRLLLLLLLAFSVVSGRGEAVRIQHFGEDEGFSATLVQHMIQDRRGYVWLATWDGLRRYDGYAFRTFKARPGDNCPLETNRISYIEEDAEGNILCFSNEKPYLFNTRSERFETYNKKVKPKVYHAPEHVEKLIRRLDDYRGTDVRIMLTDRQQGIWTFTYRGLERVWEAQSHPNPPQGEGGKILYQGRGKKDEVVSALFTDRRGRLWIADKNGVIRIRKDEGERWLDRNGSIRTTPAYFGYAAYCMYEDKDGTLWIGAKPGGLFRLTPSGSGYAVRHFMPNSKDAYSINSESIYGIAEDSRHRLIIATYGGGLNIGERQADGGMRFIHCGNRLKTFPQAGLKCRCVWLLGNGTALLGTNDGLYTVLLHEPYEKMRFYVNRRHPKDASSLSNNIVMEILNTRKGELFLATSGGGTERILSSRLLSDTIRFEHFSVLDGISSDMNQTLTEDLEGNLWIVSAGSVSLLVFVRLSRCLEDIRPRRLDGYQV